MGKPVLIVRALYGLKSSGARWHDHMAQTLREAGFTASKADPDVWMRPKTKPDGFEYWEYVLCYVDDILAISHDPMAVMEYLKSHYTLKNDSVKEPTQYLGAMVFKWRINGVDDEDKLRWAMSAEAYIKMALKDVEKTLADAGKQLPSRVNVPFSNTDYRPELDDTPELTDSQANYYQGLIGILRWIVELGRVDVVTEVAMMSSFMANPREGHLNQVFHIFAYLKKHMRSALVFDDTLPDLSRFTFTDCDWSEFYPGAKEPIPTDRPKPRGNSVTVTCWVDASHAGCRVTRRSHTGIFIFVNRALIGWYSKRQNTVESSTFGSEFVAMRTAVDQIEALRYKLRMFGVPIDGPAAVICDNEGVVKNTTAPESTLKKKHTAICYHRCREAVAAGTISVAQCASKQNLADIATKCVAGPLRKPLVRQLLW